jgi:hypothetical protein
MSLASQELDTLIAEITTDCYDVDEELTAFGNVFDEDAQLPCSATVIGEHVDVVAIGLTNGRRELVATCRRGGRQHRIALLDVDIRADPTFSRLLAAYRRWLGTTDGDP